MWEALPEEGASSSIASRNVADKTISLSQYLSVKVNCDFVLLWTHQASSNRILSRKVCLQVTMKVAKEFGHK